MKKLKELSGKLFSVSYKIGTLSYTKYVLAKDFKDAENKANIIMSELTSCSVHNGIITSIVYISSVYV